MAKKTIPTGNTPAPQNNPLTKTITIREMDLEQLLDEIKGMTSTAYDITQALSLIRNGGENIPAKALASLSMDSLHLWAEILDKAHDNMTAILQGASHA